VRAELVKAGCSRGTMAEVQGHQVPVEFSSTCGVKLGFCPQVPIGPDCALEFSTLTMGPMKCFIIEHEDVVSRLTENVNETVDCSETSTAQSTVALITTPSVKPKLIMIYEV
jgi:hypothetical protein